MPALYTDLAYSPDGSLLAAVPPFAVGNVEPDIIALRIDPFHLIGRDAQQFRAVRHPEFTQPAARGIVPRAFAARNGPVERMIEIWSFLKSVGFSHTSTPFESVSTRGEPATGFEVVAV